MDMSRRVETDPFHFILIEQGEVYAPAAQGIQSVLISNESIIKIGEINSQNVLALDPACEIIDAKNCIVIPGFIDPHQHLIGAGGEEGFTSRMPEILLSQEIHAGITTVIGLLGTDTTTRHIECLHAKTCQFYNEGITAYMYTGGFELPLRTLLGTAMDDVVMIDKIIGTGELAIADYRYVEPQPHELAKVVTQTMLGGMMGGKAGVTHFHVGDGKRRLSILEDLLDNYDIQPESVYPTHITRNPELMEDAIALAKRGSYVDMDTVEENIADCWQYYRDHGGPMDKLTVSSDAHTKGGSPAKLYEQFVSCVREHELPLEHVLPCFTANPAAALELSNKGRLEVQMDADVVILNKESLDIVHVIARGKHFINNGQLVIKSKQEEQMEEARP